MRWIEDRLARRRQDQRSRLLAALAAGHRYGLDLAREARIRPGTLYVLLAELENAGRVTSRWDDTRAGRLPRRAYELAERTTP